MDDAGRIFSMDARVVAVAVAVDADVAVVRVDVLYSAPTEQEYRDLVAPPLGADGRVADFEEWAYWPGKPHSATKSLPRNSSARSAPGA